MRWSVLVLCFVSLSAWAGLSSEEKGALKSLNHYYERVSATPVGDRHLEEACPKLIGLALGPTGETLLIQDYTRGRGERLWDPEVQYPWYVGRFEKLNGPDTTFTSWNQFSDGFSRPTQDPLFRNLAVRFSMKLTLRPTVRLTQTLTLTPYTLGFVRSGRAHVIETQLIRQADEGLLLKRLINAAVVRECQYRIVRSAENESHE